MLEEWNVCEGKTRRLFGEVDVKAMPKSFEVSVEASADKTRPIKVKMLFASISDSAIVRKPAIINQ